MLGFALKDFRDGNVGAPLKLSSHITVQQMVNCYFRDGNVAAPLKREWRFPNDGGRRNFRDGNVAAPLKHGRATDREHLRKDFRDGNVAAPLKRLLELALKLPRRKRHGPIGSVS